MARIASDEQLTIIAHEFLLHGANLYHISDKTGLSHIYVRNIINALMADRNMILKYCPEYIHKVEKNKTTDTEVIIGNSFEKRQMAFRSENDYYLTPDQWNKRYDYYELKQELQ